MNTNKQINKQQQQEQREFRFIEYKNGFYQGDLYQGKRDGKGIYYFDGGQVFIGNWKNDMMEGQGVYYFSEGGYYSGIFRKSKAHDTGIIVNNQGDQILVGTFKNGKFFEKYYRFDLKENLLYTMENQKALNQENIEVFPSIPSLKDTYREIFENFNLSKNQNRHFSILEFTNQSWYIGYVNFSMMPLGIGIIHTKDFQAISRGYFQGTNLYGFGRQLIGNFYIHDGIFLKDELQIGVKYDKKNNNYEYGTFASSNQSIKTSYGQAIPAELLKAYKHPSNLTSDKIEKSVNQNILDCEVFRKGSTQISSNSTFSQRSNETTSFSNISPNSSIKRNGRSMTAFNNTSSFRQQQYQQQQIQPKIINGYNRQNSITSNLNINNNNGAAVLQQNLNKYQLYEQFQQQKKLENTQQHNLQDQQAYQQLLEIMQENVKNQQLQQQQQMKIQQQLDELKKQQYLNKDLSHVSTTDNSIINPTPTNNIYNNNNNTPRFDKNYKFPPQQQDPQNNNNITAFHVQHHNSPPPQNFINLQQQQQQQNINNYDLINGNNHDNEDSRIIKEQFDKMQDYDEDDDEHKMQEVRELAQQIDLNQYPYRIDTDMGQSTYQNNINNSNNNQQKQQQEEKEQSPPLLQKQQQQEQTNNHNKLMMDDIKLSTEQQLQLDQIFNMDYKLDQSKQLASSQIQEQQQQQELSEQKLKLNLNSTNKKYDSGGKKQRYNNSSSSGKKALNNQEADVMFHSEEKQLQNNGQQLQQPQQIQQQQVLEDQNQLTTYRDQFYDQESQLRQFLENQQQYQQEEQQDQTQLNMEKQQQTIQEQQQYQFQQHEDQKLQQSQVQNINNIEIENNDQYQSKQPISSYSERYGLNVLQNLDDYLGSSRPHLQQQDMLQQQEQLMKNISNIDYSTLKRSQSNNTKYNQTVNRFSASKPNIDHQQQQHFSNTLNIPHHPQITIQQQQQQQSNLNKGISSANNNDPDSKLSKQINDLLKKQSAVMASSQTVNNSESTKQLLQKNQNKKSSKANNNLPFIFKQTQLQSMSNTEQEQEYEEEQLQDNNAYNLQQQLDQYSSNGSSQQNQTDLNTFKNASNNNIFDQFQANFPNFKDSSQQQNNSINNNNNGSHRSNRSDKLNQSPPNPYNQSQFDNIIEFQQKLNNTSSNNNATKKIQPTPQSEPQQQQVQQQYILQYDDSKQQLQSDKVTGIIHNLDDEQKYQNFNYTNNSQLYNNQNNNNQNNSTKKFNRVLSTNSKLLPQTLKNQENQLYQKATTIKSQSSKKLHGNMSTLEYSQLQSQYNQNMNQALKFQQQQQQQNQFQQQDSPFKYSDNSTAAGTNSLKKLQSQFNHNQFMYTPPKIVSNFKENNGLIKLQQCQNSTHNNSQQNNNNNYDQLQSNNSINNSNIKSIQQLQQYNNSNNHQHSKSSISHGNLTLKQQILDSTLKNTQKMMETGSKKRNRLPIFSPIVKPAKNQGSSQNLLTQNSNEKLFSYDKMFPQQQLQQNSIIDNNSVQKPLLNCRQSGDKIQQQQSGQKQRSLSYMNGNNSSLSFQKQQQQLLMNSLQKQSHNRSQTGMKKRDFFN